MSDREVNDAAAFGSKVPQLKDIFVGDLAETADWVVANLETKLFWSVSAQKVTYRGEALWIVPVTETSYPAVAMKARPDFPRPACEKLIMRFLSALGWVESHGMSVVGFTGGGRPQPLSRTKRLGMGITAAFELSYLPEPDDERALLAMALMRESRSLNHPGYAFLSAYRVLEVAFGKKKAPAVAWMATTIPTIEQLRPKQVIADLAAKGVGDIPAHLYDSGRCAMAHAAEEPIVDPDAPEDLRRLSSELPLMEALAVRAIEEVYGVETLMTRFKKHLYELAGFKSHFGNDLVQKFARNEPISDEVSLDVPPVSLRIYGQPQFTALEGLLPEFAGRNDTTLILGFSSLDGHLKVQIGLNFGTERLEFEMFRDVFLEDVGTTASAQQALDLHAFLEALFLNGQLEILNAETGDRLSIKDAYIPTNMMFNNDASKARRAELQRVVEERKQREP